MDDSDRLSALHQQLAERLGQQRYEFLIGAHTSFELSSFDLRRGTLRVISPTTFEMQGLKRRLNQTLLSSVVQLWGEEVTVQYEVAAMPQDVPQEDRTTPSDNNNNNNNNNNDNNAVVESAAEAISESQPRSRPEHPNPPKNSTRENRQPHHPNRPGVKSNFSNFVVGKGNKLAYQTAHSVVDRLGHYGPLLLFGPPGVGKTHLVYSMLQRLRQGPSTGHPTGSSRLRAARLTAEQFTGEFLDALDRRVLPGFRQKYRSIDALFVEDIQFLVGKRATLDEMLHCIDTLHERGRQVVLTSDRSPGELQKVSTDLVSRISGGLAIPLEMPDFATRKGVVRQLATRLGVALDDPTIELIASQVSGSARQLSGAINRLVATSQAHDQPIAVDFARTILADYVQQNAPGVRLADIQRAVCDVFGVEPATLKSNRKSRSIAEPRMLAMWLARKYTRSALGEIGEYFGRRSHSTVISAQKKIEGLVTRGAEISVADRPCPVEEAIRRVESVLRTA